MTWVIDLLALIGGILLAGGVFLEYGASWALMVSGSLLIAFALKSAKTQEDDHVSNS